MWKLESAGGYTESFLQLPKTFEQLPAKGIRLAMIPNRGVLLATGTDEPGGLAALLAVARKSMQEAPWPLCGDLFEITPAGVKLYSPTGPEANALATVQRIDISSVERIAYRCSQCGIESREPTCFTGVAKRGPQKYAVNCITCNQPAPVGSTLRGVFAIFGGALLPILLVIGFTRSKGIIFPELLVAALIMQPLAMLLRYRANSDTELRMESRREHSEPRVDRERASTCQLEAV